MQVLSVTEVLRPEGTIIMFGSSQVQVDNNCPISKNSSLDAIFGNHIFMVATNYTVFDTLNLRENFI